MLSNQLLDLMTTEIRAVGGVTILAIDLNMLKLTTSHLLSSMLVLIVIMFVRYFYF
ncbi:hypothetical protein NRIC_09100 [Enterococcus florum]|uniref:Uncharacterized protein n=1 Tax=Enterococcus florum TaxID=2480627 RepID=A0A4V0WP89_9ENTE|nr:hypothetical protein NRIC_09100 [Enterococcus florum]